MLAEYLDRYRMTFELKCEGLTAEQLATRSVPPSPMSLLGARPSAKSSLREDGAVSVAPGFTPDQYR